jgi:hypothetical protein
MVRSPFDTSARHTQQIDVSAASYPARQGPQWVEIGEVERLPASLGWLDSIPLRLDAATRADKIGGKNA